METLITKTSIARLLNADPRAKILQGLTPVAYLLNGRTKKSYSQLLSWKSGNQRQ
jgi:hypothetical protein